MQMGEQREAHNSLEVAGELKRNSENGLREEQR
jgi:hypothetical protein